MRSVKRMCSYELPAVSVRVGDAVVVWLHLRGRYVDRCRYWWFDQESYNVPRTRIDKFSIISNDKVESRHKDFRYKKNLRICLKYLVFCYQVSTGLSYCKGNLATSLQASSQIKWLLGIERKVSLTEGQNAAEAGRNSPAVRPWLTLISQSIQFGVARHRTVSSLQDNCEFKKVWANQSDKITRRSSFIWCKQASSRMFATETSRNSDNDINFDP